MKTDPTTLGIFERLDKYPDSLSDEDLRWLTEKYDSPRGKNARIPIMAFLILEEREKREKYESRQEHDKAR